MTASPLKAWWRSAHRRRRHGLALLPPISLPFPEDAARARLARYRALFALMSKNIDAVTDTASTGVLTPIEALAVVKRHATRLRYDLAALEKDEAQS